VNPKDQPGRPAERRGPHHSGRTPKQVKLRELTDGQRKARQKQSRALAKRRRTPHHIPHVPVQDTKTSRCHCEVCGNVIVVDIETCGGHMVYWDTGPDHTRHRHQPPNNSAAANRARLAEARAREGSGEP